MSFHIVEFGLENYKSFKNAVTFSMVAANLKCHKNHYFNFIPKTKNAGILKLAYIFGGTNAGKSNLLNGLKSLLAYMRGDRLVPCEYDPFDSTKPVKMMLRFYLNGVQYQYDLEIREEGFGYEKLVFWPKSRDALLYEYKSADDVKWGKYFKSAYKGIGPFILKNDKSGSTKFSVLLNVRNSPLSSLKEDLNKGAWDRELNENISHVDSYYQEKSKPYYGYGQEKPYFEAFYELFQKDPELKVWMNETISSMGLGIESFDIIKQPYLGYILSFTGLDGRNVSISNKVFEIFKELPRIYYSLKYGYPCFFDDFNPHTFIKEYIRNGFLYRNPLNAQLIWITDDTHLMDCSYCRRDEVYFVDKVFSYETKEPEFSELFSLVDFGDMKNIMSFDRMYNDGAFGAHNRVGSIPVVVKDEDELENEEDRRVK